jgi:hypothetical protein
VGRHSAYAYAAEAVALALVSVLLEVDAPTTILIAGAAAATTIISVARPIHYAALPQLAAAPRALVSSNAGCGIADGLGGFTGPALTGVMAQHPGPWLVAGLCTVAMLVAAGLCLRRLPATNGGGAGENALRGAAAAGVRSVSSPRCPRRR